MSKPSRNADLTLPIQDDDHIAGPNTAAITVVAYCDFECPYCGRAYPIIKDLQARLKDRLRFVFRHFPRIHKHPLAQQAAEVTRAADDKQRFPLFPEEIPAEEIQREGLVGFTAFRLFHWPSSTIHTS